MDIIWNVVLPVLGLMCLSVVIGFIFSIPDILREKDMRDNPDNYETHFWGFDENNNLVMGENVKKPHCKNHPE